MIMKTLLIALAFCCGLQAQQLRVSVSNWNTSKLAQFAGMFPAFNPNVQVLIEDDDSAAKTYTVELNSSIGTRSFECARSAGLATVCVLAEDLPDPVSVRVKTPTGSLASAVSLPIKAWMRNWNRVNTAAWQAIFPRVPVVPDRERVEVWFNDPATQFATEDTKYVVEIRVGTETLANKVVRHAGDVMDSVTTFYVEAPDKVSWTIYTPSRSGVSQ